MAAFPESEPDGQVCQARPVPVETTIRRRELARIWALTTAAQEGSLLIVGEPGTGKTRLLDAVEAVPGVVMHRLRINPAEAEVPLSGLSAILASFQDPEVLALSGKLLLPPGGHAQMATQAAGLLSLIREFTPPSTLLLIDDADLMDQDSQTVFAMVAARLGGTGLRIVGTVSTEPLVGSLASLPRLKLARLDFGDSMALVSELTGPQADEAVCRIVVSASSGNPQALAHNAGLLTEQQLVRAAPITLPFRVSRGPSAQTVDEPGSASAGQRLLLARLSCAYLSSHDAIMRGSGSTPAALEDLLSEGSVLREGRYLRIGDPVLRSRVYWSLDAGTRLEFHAAAARAEDRDEPGLAAWHLSWVDADRVSPGQLFAAATEFTRQGLIWQAVELAERALALACDTMDTSAALFDLAQAMFLRAELSYAGRYARLGQRRPGAASIVPRLAILRTRIEFMSTQQLLTADIDDWVSMRGSEAPDDTAYVLAVVSLCRAERWEVDLAKESLWHARQLLEGCSAETVEMYNLSTMLLAALEGDPGPTNKMFERVSHHSLAETPAQTLIVLGRSLTFVDRYVEARRIFKAIINLEPAPDPIWLEATKYYLAENEILAGNQFEAVATIDQLDSSGPGAQLQRSFHQLLMSWYWQAKANRGEADAAIAECHRSFAAGDNPALAARLVAYQGRFALMHGRFEDAIAFLRTAASIGASFKNPSLLRYQVDLIEAYVLSGRLSEAMAQFQEFRVRSLPYRTRWTMLASARADALVTPGVASISAFQRAVKLWHPGDSPFELGRTVLSYADRLASLGHNQESREQYLAAQMIFTQLGAIIWAKKANAVRLDHDSAREHPLMATLTTDERLVAKMVCQGLRNKEISAGLFVSLRTVEVRLTRVYQKLGARSRSHLTAMLSSADAAAADQAVDWTS